MGEAIHMARPLLALLCATLALVAVLCIMDSDSLSKESVVPGSVDADVEVAKATETPEDEFVEVNKLFSSWKAGTNLGNSVMAAVVKAGQTAQAPKVVADPTIGFPSSSKKISTKQMQLTQY